MIDSSRLEALEYRLSVLEAGQKVVVGAVAGLELLGSSVLGADAASLGPVAIAARDLLVIQVRVVGFSVAGLPGLRFNADAGNNYWDRNLHAAAGGATWTNTQTATTSMVRLAGQTGTLGLAIAAFVNNRLATSKPVTFQTAHATGAVATVGRLSTGAGEWVNTVAQITSVTLVATAGNLLAGSGVAIYGRNL